MSSIDNSLVIGLLLALSSCLFIGLSFIIKKIGLIRLSNRGLRASNGGFGYLKDWVWWTGLTLMGIGETANFAAYAFAPASLVTPLGGLSVLITAILANRYLKENMNVLAKIGCILCLLGSTVIVIHSPKERQINSLDAIGVMLLEPLFVIYLIFVSFTSFLLITFYGPKYGSKNVLVYVLICSLIGSLSVMSCKGIGIAIRQTFTQTNQMTNSLFWILLISVIITVSIQMNYLNKSLDIFDTSIVTPIYYVFFTTFVIMASAILFKEWHSMTAENIIGSVSGFLIVIIAIFLINAFKDFQITFESIRSQLKLRRNPIIINELNAENETKLLSSELRCDITPGLITWTAADEDELFNH